VTGEGRDVDPLRLRSVLDRWVEPPVTEELTVRLIEGGRSNPTYEVSAGDRSWVLRRPPYGFVLPTAHDMAREFTVIHALEGTAVPVPRTVGLCEDATVIGAPFYVMERLPGTTLRSARDTASLRVEERRRLSENMLDALAALHEVVPEEVGLAGWGRPEGYLERQMRRWTRQWEASSTSPRPEVGELVRRLGRAVPTTRHVGIVHGDFKIDNMMVDPRDRASILGVLDWEMSTLGDTLTDLGILLSFWDEPGSPHHPIVEGATALPGFLSRAELIEGYAARRGIELDAIDWYVVFADFKVAVILEGIHTRYLRGHAVGEGFETVGDMVGVLLDRALARASVSATKGLRG
jgi:aminoglycoside phosphotransferase (APT) family kinase protein